MNKTRTYYQPCIGEDNSTGLPMELFSFQAFSSEYDVRRITESDITDVYKLCKTNKRYYRYMGRIPTKESLTEIISNVPAAMLLSAFTGDGASLVVGSNLGGLGTLIASMASLISYKYHAKLPQEEKGGKYIPAFTVVNIILLALLLAFHYILKVR